MPPIFVSQRPDGVWDVIDGLQRLSTIYELVGILCDEKNTPLQPLVLEETKFLPSLKGKVWDDRNDEANSLDSAQRLFIKRSKFGVNIVLRESDESTKYELFQRLNTGGSQLSDQEVRNCILVEISRDMYFWLKALAEYSSFRNCTLLSDRALDEQYDYDMELVLRFIVFRSLSIDALGQIGDLGDFLTNELIRIAQSNTFDQQQEEQAFKTTFDILDDSTGADSFRRFDANRLRFVGGFLVTPYEVFAVSSQ